MIFIENRRKSLAVGKEKIAVGIARVIVPIELLSYRSTSILKNIVPLVVPFLLQGALREHFVQNEALLERSSNVLIFIIYAPSAPVREHFVQNEALLERSSNVLIFIIYAPSAPVVETGEGKEPVRVFDQFPHSSQSVQIQDPGFRPISENFDLWPPLKLTKFSRVPVVIYGSRSV